MGSWRCPLRPHLHRRSVRVPVCLGCADVGSAAAVPGGAAERRGCRAAWLPSAVTLGSGAIVPGWSGCQGEI